MPQLRHQRTTPADPEHPTCPVTRARVDREFVAQSAAWLSSDGPTGVPVCRWQELLHSNRFRVSQTGAVDAYLPSCDRYAERLSSIYEGRLEVALLDDGRSVTFEGRWIAPTGIGVREITRPRRATTGPTTGIPKRPRQ